MNHVETLRENAKVDPIGTVVRVVAMCRTNGGNSAVKLSMMVGLLYDTLNEVNVLSFVDVDTLTAAVQYCNLVDMKVGMTMTDIVERAYLTGSLQEQVAAFYAMFMKVGGYTTEQPTHPE